MVPVVVANARTKSSHTNDPLKGVDGFVDCWINAATPEAGRQSMASFLVSRLRLRLIRLMPRGGSWLSDTCYTSSSCFMSFGTRDRLHKLFKGLRPVRRAPKIYQKPKIWGFRSGPRASRGLDSDPSRRAVPVAPKISPADRF